AFPCAATLYVLRGRRKPLGPAVTACRPDPGECGAGEGSFFRLRPGLRLVLAADHALALFLHAIIAPPQMRGRAAQRPPRFAERRHLLWRRPRLEAEPDLDAFLYGDVAGRPGVAMAEAEQEIDVGGPRPDAVQRGQRVMRRIRVLVGEDVEIQPPGGEFARDVFQGLDLGRRQPEPAESLGARLTQALGMKRIERGREARPDCAGAGGRKLLAGDDMGEARETRLAPPQRRHARQFEHGFEPRILPEQRVASVFEVGLGVEVDGHECNVGLSFSSWPGLSRPSTSFCFSDRMAFLITTNIQKARS